MFCSGKKKSIMQYVDMDLAFVYRDYSTITLSFLPVSINSAAPDLLGQAVQYGLDTKDNRQSCGKHHSPSCSVTFNLHTSYSVTFNPQSAEFLKIY